MTSGRHLADGPAIAAFLGISAGTIRNWSSAGLIGRHGTDELGRILYDYDQVEEVASRATRLRDDGGRYRRRCATMTPNRAGESCPHQANDAN